MKKKSSSDITGSSLPQSISGISGNSKASGKTIQNYQCTKKPERVDTAEIPDIIPVSGDDICNYVAKYDMANFQIQAVMKLDGRLDSNRLAKAVRLSVDAEPVLGCRFVKSSKPHWKRYDDLDKVEFFTMEETDAPNEAIERFLSSPMDMDKGPVLMVRLIRSKTQDTLVVKLNHACCDAAGAREYLELLSNIYCGINKYRDFAPSSRTGSRKDHERLIDALKKSPLPEWNLMSQTAMPTWPFPWKNGRTGATGFAVCRLPEASLQRMKEYGKSKGATINDLILAAVYRALFKISRPPYGIPMDIPLTIDLRKFLPDGKADSIRNLSGGSVLRLPRKPHETFEGTLSRVISLTNRIKKGRPSIRSIKWLQFIENMDFRQIRAFFRTQSQIIEMASLSPFYIVDKCCPVFSNFGFISRAPIKFGKNTVTDAWILPPVIRPPTILLVASTYNDRITLAVGYYKPSVCKAVMENLLEKIRDELVEGCLPALSPDK